MPGAARSASLAATAANSAGVTSLTPSVSPGIIIEPERFRLMMIALLSFFSQAFVVYLLFTNITFLGGGYNYATWLGPIDAVVVLVGVGVAFYFKRYKPAKYEQAGRLINEGL